MTMTPSPEGLQEPALRGALERIANGRNVRIDGKDYGNRPFGGDAAQAIARKALSTPTSQPPAAETRLREALEAERNELMNSYGDGSWKDGQITARIAEIDAALTQPEPTAQGGEEGEIVLGLRQARHVLKDLQAKNSDQTAYGKLAQTCDIAADRLTALSAQQGGEEERAAELIRSYFDARQAGNDCPECGNEGPWEHCGPCSDRIGPVIARMSNFAINMDMHGEIAEGADKRDAVARIISLAKGAPENGQMSIGAWWWDKRHDRARPEHFEGECRDEDRKHADLMIPLLRAALSAQQAAGEAEAVENMVGLLVKAVGDITAALILAGKEDKLQRWTAPYVEAINAHDASLSTPQPTETQRIDGNEIWEALFGIMEGNVPDELTEEVCEQLAESLSSLRGEHLAGDKA